MVSGSKKVLFKVYRIYFELNSEEILPFLLASDRRTFVANGPFFRKGDILLRINKKPNQR